MSGLSGNISENTNMLVSIFITITGHCTLESTILVPSFTVCFDIQFRFPINNNINNIDALILVSTLCSVDWRSCSFEVTALLVTSALHRVLIGNKIRLKVNKQSAKVAVNKVLRFSTYILSDIIQLIVIVILLLT